MLDDHFDPEFGSTMKTVVTKKGPEFLSEIVHIFHKVIFQLTSNKCLIHTLRVLNWPMISRPPRQNLDLTFQEILGAQSILKTLSKRYLVKEVDY